MTNARFKIPDTNCQNHNRNHCKYFGIYYPVIHTSRLTAIQPNPIVHRIMSATDPNQFLRALADPTRLRIVALLRNERELCVCDLMAVLELPQSTVSRHLSYLKNADLVLDSRKGVWMYYSLRVDQQKDMILEALRKMLADEEQAASDLQKLTEYLASKDVDACS